MNAVAQAAKALIEKPFPAIAKGDRDAAILSRCNRVPVFVGVVSGADVERHRNRRSVIRFPILELLDEPRVDGLTLECKVVVGLGQGCFGGERAWRNHA
jgi:hypothetical protein